VEVSAPVIRSFFLPLAFRNQCLPAKRYSDVALVLDTSSSMAEDNKLGQAVAAAKTFTRLLRLPRDQAAVVGFSDQAIPAQPLTGSRAVLEARLDGLTTGSGTRIDRGIDVAVAELTSPRHVPVNQRVLVLLSDGRQVDEPGRVTASAEAARRAGAVVYAVGLGADADAATLRAVAGSPSRYYRAQRPEDLIPIYTQIASAVGCR
jgi:Mg-chelatase subunit ChlD